MSYRSLGKGSLLPLAFFVYAQPAFAYIDPGTGSMLLQGLLAGVAGVVIVVKLYWYKLKHFFFPLAAQEAAKEPESAPDSPAEKNN